MLTPLPPQLLQHAVEFSGPPAEPRDAATIVLLRDGLRGVETYLLRRQSAMNFAAGMYVFPGGGVQESDAEPLAWSGPSPTTWGTRFGCSPALAGMLVVAAIRETFEESGILLAGPDERSLVRDTSSDEMQEARLALDSGGISMASFLAKHDLAIRTDLLGPRGHWVTPDFEPRRYDTRFFGAAAPAGQVVGSLPGEADHAEWVPLVEIVDKLARGELAMLPPTAATCSELAGRAIADILAESSELFPKRHTARLAQIGEEYFLEHVLE